MTVDEQIECEQAVLASEEFKAALKKHYGIDDTRLVMVDIWSAGNYGSEEDRTRRLARPLCFLRSDPTENGYARPIEGLRPVVDLNLMQVIRVEDYGRWPLPPGECNYAADRVKNQRRDIKPLEITQPEGPSFEVEGNQVRWQNWSFVIGFNAREGLTLHHLRYRDGGKDRSILYRASLTEMVVPYGDPGPTQRRKNAFDVGEYGMGMCANSLELGCDCLGLIRYFDAHMVTSRGEPLHDQERHLHARGRLRHPLEAHRPPAAASPEVRRSRRLVISSVSTVENYEYGFFWYLYQDGNIQLEVKLTGMLSLGAFPPGERPRYGTLVAPQVYAPNHQHFFNVRLDFDLDGMANTVQQVDVVPDELGRGQPVRKRLPGPRDDAQDGEAGPRAPESAKPARTWKIVNHDVRNAVGEPVGYKFVPGDNAFPMASPQCLVAQAGRLRESSRVGHALSRRRTLRRRRLSQSKLRRRRPDPLDRAGPAHRIDRRRLLVHDGPHAPAAARRLPRDAHRLHRLPAQAAGLLRAEPGQRRAALGQAACREGVVLHG